MKEVKVNDFFMNKVGKQDLINRGKVNRKEKLAPVFDANLYESHVERRKGKHEVYMKKTGKFPCSFYLVNRVLYVGDHLFLNCACRQGYCLKLLGIRVIRWMTQHHNKLLVI